MKKPLPIAGVLRVTLGLLATLGLGVYLTQHLGWRALWQPWQAIAPGLLVSALLAQALSYAARAARLARAEPDIGLRGFARCLRLVLIHNASNLLLPMRSGELSFVWLMRRDFGIGALHAGGTLLCLRISDLLVLLNCALFAALLRGWTASAAILLSAALALLGPWLLFRVVAMLRESGAAPAWAQKVARGFPDEAHRFREALLWTWLSWLLKLAGLSSVFAALGGGPQTVGVLAAIAGDLSTVLPVHAPAGLGTYEAAAIGAAAAWTPITPALTTAVVGIHGFVLVTALSLGAIAALLALSSAAALRQRRDKL